MSYMHVGEWQPFDEAGRRKYLNSLERKRFLTAADEMASEVCALCHVLAYSGCRISEALALTRHQIDTERNALVIRTLKRRKLRFRIVPIPKQLVRQLVTLTDQADDRLFPMHRSTAWRNVKEVMSLAGIHGPMATCKGLRHGFGMRAAGSSIPANLIQKWLGHASPTTSAI